MKFHKTYFFLASAVGGFLCLALIVALIGYFRAVESGSVAVGSERRLASQLKIFHDQFRRAEGPEEAKVAFKLAESITGFGPESELHQELKKTYAPVLAAFASKPREAGPKFALVKKRELMEYLVNSYRREVLHGDLRIRAGYLNVLFDTQNSLLGETDEAEQVYLKRNHERLESMRTVAGTLADPGVASRVAGAESIFSGYERGFQQALKWRADRDEALGKVEKSLPGLAKGIYSGQDFGMDDTRRGFLYVCFLALLAAVVGFLTLYLGFKVMRVRAELKMDSFLAYLRTFGTESVDPKMQAVVQGLRDDADWAPVVAEAQRAEESFLRSCHNLLAVPRSLGTPFLVVGKDRVIRHWNENAGKLFGLTDGKQWGVGDVLVPERLNVKEGEIGSVLELIKSSLSSHIEDRFDLLVRCPDGWQPYELTMSPVTTGPLAGGRILVWREVRGEADRLDRAVGAQLERVRDIVHKVTHQYEVSLDAREGDVPAARAMIGDLSLLKGRMDEREILWKSEAQALIDQVTRQQEILGRLGEELHQVRQGQTEALELVRSVRGGEEHLLDEVCVLERDLERWSVGRKRLVNDLQQQAVTLDRARKFEERLRASTEEMGSELETYEDSITELRQFADAAKVHSVNLSLVRDPGYWEYASRARAFAHELSQFVAKAEAIGEKIRHFVSAHPGGALAAHLNGVGLDASITAEIAEEQELLGKNLRRWRESSEAMLVGGEKAVSLLQKAEKQSAMLSQLGETSLLINQQARDNLERWN